VQLHEDTSKSSQTETVPKTILTFDTVYAVGRVSATAGGTTETGCFETCVQQSASISEFQGHPGHNALLTAIYSWTYKEITNGQIRLARNGQIQPCFLHPTITAARYLEE
jgi:hypothetical protein